MTMTLKELTEELKFQQHPAYFNIYGDSATSEIEYLNSRTTSINFDTIKNTIELECYPTIDFDVFSRIIKTLNNINLYPLDEKGNNRKFYWRYEKVNLISCQMKFDLRCHKPSPVLLKFNCKYVKLKENK